MSARDELAGIIDDRWHGYGYNPTGAAEAILAAGWRPPARVITTREELNKLTEGVVIIDRDGDVVIADPGPEDVWFRQIDETWPLSAGTIALPATVLYDPGHG